MIVTLDPRLKYNYASWYLQGIKMLLERTAVTYGVEPFRGLKYESNEDLNAEWPRYLRKAEKNVKSLLILRMWPRFSEDRYEWCDVYAMVNPKKEQLEQHPKAMAIGPSLASR